MSKSRPFRAEDWWIGKASSLLGLVYLFSIIFNIRFENFWIWAACSLVTITGFASFGYLTNDYFDQEKDALAGKKNFLLGKPALTKVGYFLIALLLLFGPWCFLPYDKVTIILIAAQLLAYFLYSIPGIRLKERGILGLITDAMYAHAVPAVMAAYTYELIAGRGVDLIFFVLLFAWQFCAGLRNVILHQLSDLESDKRSKTNTFISRNEGVAPGHFLLFLKGVELSFLIALIILLYSEDGFFVIPLVAIAMAGLTSYFLKKTNAYRFYFPNILYDQWLPYSFIIILSISDIRFLILVPVQAILFSGSFVMALYSKIPWGDLRDVMKSVALAISIACRLAINWAIYVVFRIFFVDLIKEKTDAKGYILRKMNKQKQ